MAAKAKWAGYKAGQSNYCSQLESVLEPHWAKVALSTLNKAAQKVPGLNELVQLACLVFELLGCFPCDMTLWS